MTRLLRTALVTLVVCFAAAAAAQAPSYFGLRFPDTVAGFPRGAVKDFETEHPGLGYGVKYNGNGWIIDVFIYDDAIKDIPDDLSANVVTTQFNQAQGDIHAREKQGNLRVEDKSRFGISGPNGKPRYSCGTYLITENGRQIDSYLCLTTWHGKFVKYRLSTLAKDGSLAKAKRFVSAWTATLWP